MSPRVTGANNGTSFAYHLRDDEGDAVGLIDREDGRMEKELLPGTFT